MTSTERLRVAIQKSGRLSGPSRALLNQCGLDFPTHSSDLVCFAKNMPIDLLLVRDDDIPGLIAQGVCDVGIVGRNVLAEHALAMASAIRPVELRPLGFGQCRLSLAAPAGETEVDNMTLQGQRIATSYPNLLSEWLTQQGIEADIVTLGGSVEIAPQLGTADLICDLVSTGATLKANRLREICVVMESEAVLAAPQTTPEGPRAALLERLLGRMAGVIGANESRLLVFKAPRHSLHNLLDLLPDASAPLISPIEGQPNDVSLQCLCREPVSWQDLETMQQAGAQGMLVLPVDKMLA